MKSFRRFNEGMQDVIPMTDQAIEEIEKQLTELKTFEDTQLDQLKEMEEDGENYMEGLEEMLNSSGLPKPMIRILLYNFTLLMDDRFRNTLKLVLNRVLELLKKGIVKEDMEKDAEISKLKEQFGTLSAEILKIPKEELDKITAQFMQGVNKFQKLKEENAEISNSKRNLEADPFAEENWSGESEADMLKKSFESKKYR